MVKVIMNIMEREALKEEYKIAVNRREIWKKNKAKSDMNRNIKRHNWLCVSAVASKICWYNTGVLLTCTNLVFSLSWSEKTCMLV